MWCCRGLECDSSLTNITDSAVLSVSRHDAAPPDGGEKTLLSLLSAAQAMSPPSALDKTVAANGGDRVDGQVVIDSLTSGSVSTPPSHVTKDSAAVVGPVAKANIPVSGVVRSQQSAGLSDGEREMLVEKIYGIFRTYLTGTYGWLSVCTVDESDPVGGSSSLSWDSWDRESGGLTYG